MVQFLKFRLLSFKYAFRGLWLLIKTEHSVIAQVFIAVVLICSGFCFDISQQDWINQLLVIGLVLGVEGMNTAVEKLADFVHEDQHPRIGFIKDISAGAVAFAALFGFVVVTMIYLPYLRTDA
ncbi:MAG: diacylglycerol kinase family protein [Flavobacteriaceae bacterium]|nr:diacylglycerol kinase family protein [Flavobacteriaceae bacterium]